MIVNGTDVTVKGIDNISEQEILAYMDFIHQDNRNDEIESLEISAQEGDNVALDYTLRPPQFQRIRRITGYLGKVGQSLTAACPDDRERLRIDVHLSGTLCHTVVDLQRNGTAAREIVVIADLVRTVCHRDGRNLYGTHF